MEETAKSFWDKTTLELTVKDQLIIAAAVPAIMVGGCIVVGGAMAIGNKVSSKFQSFRENRQNNTDKKEN